MSVGGHRNWPGPGDAGDLRANEARGEARPWPGWNSPWPATAAQFPGPWSLDPGPWALALGGVTRFRLICLEPAGLAVVGGAAW